MTPSEYKGFERENLRDHRMDLELIFSMLGVRATTEITHTKDTKGFKNLQKDTHNGGTIAGDARKALQKKTGEKVSSPENYLIAPQDQKRLDYSQD